MADVAVVVHSGKSFGGGLSELRTVLAGEGVTYPLWYEVRKSRHAVSVPESNARSRTGTPGSPAGW
jgi:hypothetical protein